MDLLQSLKTQYYAPVPFALPRHQIEEAVQAFFAFLNEPDEVKSHMNFFFAPKHRRGDAGFYHREPGDHIYNDSKDFFHYHPDMYTKFPEFIKSQPVVKDFLDKAKPIWEQVYKTVDSILREIQHHVPGAHSKVFEGTGNMHISLRFLKYEWATSEKYLAKPHFDAGSFTLAVAESTPGLRIGSGPENLKLVEHQDGTALFMVSSNFQTVMESDALQPAWHDVIQLDETAIGLPYARWAVVAFIEAQDVEALPRTETHKFYTADVA